LSTRFFVFLIKKTQLLFCRLPLPNHVCFTALARPAACLAPVRSDTKLRVCVCLSLSTKLFALGPVRYLVLTQGAPVFPGSSRLGTEPKTPGWLVQDTTTSPVGKGGGVRSGPAEARTILLLHIIGARPSKQPLTVRTFLKVYMKLGSFFLFLREQ
jgi:hypothetical protein